MVEQNSQLQNQGWALDDKLITGEVNGPNVKQIIERTFRNKTYLYFASQYIWSEKDTKKFIKEVLNQQYNSQKKAMKRASLSFYEQAAAKMKDTFQSRKSVVS